MKVREIYRHRWDEAERTGMVHVWKVLCENFFQKFIPSNARVLDLGGGYCNFINHIRAEKRVVFDANPDVQKYAHPDVEVIQSSDLTLPMIPDGSVSHVFVSHFLEHLPSSSDVLKLLETLQRKKPGIL